jgi:hypothetical protein
MQLGGTELDMEFTSRRWTVQKAAGWAHSPTPLE